MSEPNPDFVHEKVQGIDVVTFCCAGLETAEEFTRIKDGLFELVDGGVEYLVLDCSNIKYATGSFVGMLVAVRNRISVGRPCQNFRPGNIFRIVDDRARAIDVISSSTSNPLVLCSVGTQTRDMFRTLRLWDGLD